MPRPLSAAHLTAIDLNPPHFIEAAAKAGFDGVGLRLLRVTDTSPGYPLYDDLAMLRATKAAMAATGLTVGDIEFLKVTPDTRVADYEWLFDVGADLGAHHLITAPYDSDLSRLSDTLSALAEAGRSRGVAIIHEFFPWTNVPDLDTALRVVERAGPEVHLLVDSLHFDRSGSSLVQLAAISPERLPFAHLCDALVAEHYTTDELLLTAREARLAPGEGQIDLRAFVEALPDDLPLSLEVPMVSADGPEAVLGHVCEVTRNWLAQGA
ncbi:sugar phosphate isomerase/epimerase family protein [Sulfitobacter sp. M22]|jgi:sugar phosphate isomerase/epimerase|uniref:sugar phosphate isomerase/epimerase family protein n=1 Tax=Sulfitobacter sp. M22 TaxID=2675332 RepID=UPI001F2CB6E0|nr:sugar phosphate isomerase/epimerase [Sulfitobacter sp. M22]MCF7728431.1 TIM barrel protein [Sulfitobacter sp. M22]|tara:strand:- start:3909 stop:4709 length:801 start_codon:yes stop_codon:yes gene_type:complete